MDPSAPFVVQALHNLHDTGHTRTGWQRAAPRASIWGDRWQMAAFGEMPLRLVMRFTVATYNIHKGFSHLARRMVIHELRDRLHGLSADILFLQEVQGAHRRHALRYRDWPGK